MAMLTDTQINDFAQTVAYMAKTIEQYFADPTNEQAYQDWYFKKYGHYEKESNYD